MFPKKIAKSQQADKTPYTIYNPHTVSLDDRKWSGDEYWILSIDPGNSHFAMRIEVRPVSLDRPFMPYTKLFEKVKLNDKLIDTYHNTTYEFLTDYLQSKHDLILQCHYIILERQLPENYKMVRLAQHTLSYFLILLKNSVLLPVIIEIDPKLKGKQLDAPSNINKRGLKLWSVAKAKELLQLRDDQVSLDILNKLKTKKDDLSDTVCQLEAMVIQWELPSTDDLVLLHDKPVIKIQMKAKPRLVITN